MKLRMSREVGGQGRKEAVLDSEEAHVVVLRRDKHEAS